MNDKKQTQGKEYKKYIELGTIAFSVIAASMVLFFCIFRLSSIMAFISKVITILKPFIFGLVIAYLLNPAFYRIYGCLFGFLYKKVKLSPDRADGISKVISSILSVMLLVCVVATLLGLIIPELYGSVMNFTSHLSTYMGQAEKWLRNFLEQYPDIESTVLAYYDKISETVMGWVTDTFMPSASTMFNAVSKGVGSTFSLIYNFIIGMIVAVYMLNSKDLLLSQIRKLIYGLLRKDHADALLEEAKYANQAFSGYVSGQLIDACVVGLVTFVVGWILKLPYYPMISTIVGITNIIPFFGPYIGAVPSAIILLLTNPWACLKFVIAILVIQQVDGNFIAPRILGNATGVSSFWVLFSILLFGGLFNFVGMLIGVPVFAVIYHVVKTRVEYLLSRKGMPQETRAYGGSGAVYQVSGKAAKEETDESDK